MNPVPRRRPSTAALAAIAVFAMLAIPGAALSQDAPSAGPIGNASLFVLDGQTVKVITEATQQFNSAGKGTVEVTPLAGDSYQQKIRTIVRSAKRPDMFFNWGGDTIRDYVDANLLLDLGPLIKANPAIAEGFQSSVLGGGQIYGKQYGIPINGTQPVVLFYNKKIFDQAGLTPPATWDDLLKVIEAFKQQGVTPIALAGSQAWCELMYMEYLVDRYGGPELFASIADGDWSKWNDPAILEAAKAIRALVDAGAFGTNYSSVGYAAGGSTSLLASGKAAMELMGTWEYPVAQSIDADFVKNDMAFVPFPAIAGGKGDAGNLVGNPANYVSVTAGAQNMGTIAAFLEMLSTDDYTRALMQNAEVSTTKTAINFVDAFPNPEFAKQQLGLVSNAKSFQLSWDLAIPPGKSTPMLQNIQDLFNGAKTPEEFVSAMAAIN